MGGVAEVRAVAPSVIVLTFGQGFAVLNIVVVGFAPRAEEGVMAGTVSPGVIVVVTCIGNLVVSHLLLGWGAIDNMGGNVVVSVGIS